MHSLDLRVTACGPGAHTSTLRACRLLLLAVVVAATPFAARASEPGEPAPAATAEEVELRPAAAVSDTIDNRPPRKFLGFATDAAVSRGLWAELGEVYRQSSGGTFVTSATAAYGWSDFEFGADIAVNDSGGWSDLEFWAKYVGWKLGPADVGAGWLLEVPTSGHNFDGAPFATASLPVGLWDLRSSLGYRIGTGVFFYNGACLRPIGERIDFRTELDGRFDDGFDRHLVDLLPGLDFHFPVGDWRILIRLSAGAKLHPSVKAVAGLSFVLAQH